MKYVYSSLAVLGFAAGIYKFLAGGYTDAMLTMIFGSVCLVAAEVAELSESVKSANNSEKSNLED